MKKLIFICNQKHFSTLSNIFFVNFLKKKFDVLIVPFQNQKQIKNLLSLNVKYFVFWQEIDFAYLATLKNKKTMVIPMFDGVENYSKFYYLRFYKTILFLFSSTLYHKINSLNLYLYSAQYFPPHVLSVRKKSFTKLKLFFWERRPDTILNKNFVMEIFSKYFDEIYIQSYEDNNILQFKVNTHEINNVSFINKEQYFKILDECNFYLAPRLTEGIGMAFIEAMQRGMIVIANNKPTYSEYILSGVNGLLIDFEKVNEKYKFSKDDKSIIHDLNYFFKNKNKFLSISKRATEIHKKHQNFSNKLENLVENFIDYNPSLNLVDIFKINLLNFFMQFKTFNFISKLLSK